MSRKPSQSFGNLVIQTDSNTVRLELISYDKGRPYATFTHRELGQLVEILKTVAKPAVEVDENIWEDLI